VDEQVTQSFQHMLSHHSSGNIDRQAFSTVFIDQCEQPQWPSIMGLCMNKVVAPNMILEGGTQPDTGPIP
jgi:hypothetical protein